MGCDIHIVLEKQIEGKWTLYDQPRCSDYNKHHIDDRNYCFFYKLAQVRGFVGDDHGLEPKGLPEDVSVGTKDLSDTWGPDGHSHSWIPLWDFCRLYEKCGGKHPEADFETACEVWSNSKPEKYEPYRVVFWFDN